MIEISRSYTFDAPIDRVWALLMDTSALAACIPGCDSLEPDGENHYVVKLTVKMAAVMGHYTGSVALADLVPPQSYRLLAEGQGRPGFVKGGAEISLAAVAETSSAAGTSAPQTELTVKGSVQTGGSIARVGQRIIGGAARFMMDRFFKRLKALAEGREATDADLDAPADDPA